MLCYKITKITLSSDMHIFKSLLTTKIHEQLCNKLTDLKYNETHP